jgi:hypothetical protein
MLRTKTQIFNISSLNSENGSYKSKLLVSLPNLNFSSPDIQNVFLSVLHCEVPNSFYIVNYTNNSLVLDGVAYDIQVGNYNANTLITQLISILPVGFSITYSSINNKFTFTYSSDFTINASHPSCKINSVIGLGTSDITSTSNSLTLPYVVNFLPIPRINFRTNAFNLQNYNQTDNTGDVFLALQNNAPQQACINYYNDAQFKFSIVDKTISSFYIHVTNDKGQYINFNNIDWYLTFLIEIQYLGNPNTTNFQYITNNKFQ